MIQVQDVEYPVYCLKPEKVRKWTGTTSKAHTKKVSKTCNQDN